MTIIVPTDTVYGDPKWPKQIEIKGLGVFEQGKLVTCGGATPSGHIVVGVEYRRVER